MITSTKHDGSSKHRHHTNNRNRFALYARCSLYIRKDHVSVFGFDKRFSHRLAVGALGSPCSKTPCQSRPTGTKSGERRASRCGRKGQSGYYRAEGGAATTGERMRVATQYPFCVPLGASLPTPFQVHINTDMLDSALRSTFPFFPVASCSIF